MMESYRVVLEKVEAGDADYTAGHVASLEDVEVRTQAIIDRALLKKAG